MKKNTLTAQETLVRNIRECDRRGLRAKNVDKHGPLYEQLYLSAAQYMERVLLRSDKNRRRLHVLQMDLTEASHLLSQHIFWYKLDYLMETAISGDDAAVLKTITVMASNSSLARKAGSCSLTTPMWKKKSMYMMNADASSGHCQRIPVPWKRLPSFRPGRSGSRPERSQRTCFPFLTRRIRAGRLRSTSAASLPLVPGSTRCRTDSSKQPPFFRKKLFFPSWKRCTKRMIRPCCPLTFPAARTVQAGGSAL